jgi:DNA polymerase III, delta subunit
VFADVLGQKGTVQLLKARLRNGTALDTSYIFSGGSGQGKTTLSRIYARAMLCENLDRSDPEPCNQCESCVSILNDSSVAFSEQDAASQGGIEQIRRIVDSLPFAVVGAAKRIYLFDECFTEDTLLCTPNGHRTIRDIVESRYKGDVLSFDLSSNSVVWSKVTDWFEIQDLRDLLRLTLDNGVVLTVTPEQELFTSNRGWVKAQDLDSNDDVVEAICP